MFFHREEGLHPHVEPRGLKVREEAHLGRARGRAVRVGADLVYQADLLDRIVGLLEARQEVEGPDAPGESPTIRSRRSA